MESERVGIIVVFAIGAGFTPMNGNRSDVNTSDETELN
jgi:hypothetical protein